MTRPKYLVEIAGKDMLYDENRQKCGAITGIIGGNPRGFSRRLVIGTTVCGGEWDNGMAEFSQSHRTNATLWLLTPIMPISNGTDGNDQEPERSADTQGEPLEPTSLT